MPRTQADLLALQDFLPDPERVPSPWLQIWRDLVVPAPVSHWASQVTELRIYAYDQIRPFVTRGFLLVVLAALLAFADATSPLVWQLLLVGAAQTVLEIHLDFRLRRGSTSRFRLIQLMMNVAEERQMGQTLVNVTGVMGAVAVPLNLVCVLYLTGPGEPAWVKLAAFVVAILYGNSGILNVLLDCTFYSVRQRLPRFVTLLRAHVWLLAGAALAAMVGVSVALGRWNTRTEPAAWLACGLTYVIGMKMREYDRFLRVSGERARDAMTKARERLAHDVHDQFTGIRSFIRDLYFDENANPDSKVLAVELGTFTKEIADEQKWIAQGGRTSLPGMVEQLASDLGRNIRSDLRFGELSQRNRDLARQLITTLVTNAAQALRDDPDARISVAGLVADESVHVRVGDPLPAIPDGRWCPKGSTMGIVRERLREGGGDLTQTSTGDGKQICGVWPVKPPLIRRTSER
jgi:hypothetical protein